MLDLPNPNSIPGGGINWGESMEGPGEKLAEELPWDGAKGMRHFSGGAIGFSFRNRKAVSGGSCGHRDAKGSVQAPGLRRHVQ